MGKNIVLINKVGFYKYPDSEYNFSPSDKYPEYMFSDISPKKNEIYNAVRNSFYLMGYDRENYNTPLWNPLKNIVKHGDTVLIKPNFVLHMNEKEENGTDCVITNPSIIRAVADYVLIALNRSGKLIIGDAPLQNCDFDALIKNHGVDKIEIFYKMQNIKTKFEICDFRNYKSKLKNKILVPNIDINDNGIIVDLSKDSEFAKMPIERYKNLRVTNYPHNLMQKHHNKLKNEYIVSRKILEADVIINMPKPKTHRFAGVTIAMKNLIGINSNKECLPHHSVGSKEENGDEYERKSIIKKMFSNIVDIRNKQMRNNNFFITKILKLVEYCFRIIIYVLKPNSRTLFGSWYGNDTIWRTIIDLNKIVFFADINGKLQEKVQRKMLIIGDMIIAGEASGPLSPSPKDVGVIAIGEDPVCFDEVICTYMGYECKKIPTIKNAHLNSEKYNFYCKKDSLIISNDERINNKKISELTSELTEHFIPNPDWAEYL